MRIKCDIYYMNTYLPPHLRRIHNENLVGGSIDVMENVPLPLLEMPKPHVFVLMIKKI